MAEKRQGINLESIKNHRSHLPAYIWIRKSVGIALKSLQPFVTWSEEMYVQVCICSPSFVSLVPGWDVTVDENRIPKAGCRLVENPRVSQTRRYMGVFYNSSFVYLLACHTNYCTSLGETFAKRRFRDRSAPPIYPWDLKFLFFYDDMRIEKVEKRKSVELVHPNSNLIIYFLLL